MNKKINESGFTLIELLAIIVILGIIAVIAVPTVKKLTDEAKMKAFENTARGIIKAGNLYYSRKDMMDELNGDMTFSFPDNAEELELQGKLPENGKMVINEDGDIALAISNKKYCITKGLKEQEFSIIEDTTNCELPPAVNGIMTSKDYCILTNICESGTLINVKVNDTQNYDFYVISDTETELTLIMDRSLEGTPAWNSSYTVGKGPVTALEHLKNATDSWVNIPLMSYVLNDDGDTSNYSNLEVTDVRARLLTYTEATSPEIGCTETKGSCPSWLYENLDGLELPIGHWLSTAYSSSNGWLIRSSGALDSSISVGQSGYYGIRPVITLTK